MNRNRITALGGGAVALACLAVALAAWPAHGHLAVDEVAEFGAAGYGTDQLSHSHPHNRTVFYAYDNGTHWSSPIDLYEAALGANGTAPAPSPAAPEPERIVVRNTVDFDVPETVMIGLHDATVSCPEGEGHDRVKMRSQHFRHNQLFWSSAYHDGHLVPVYIYDHTDTPTAGGDMLAFWGDVDPESNTYHVIAMVEDSQGQLCDGHAPIFTVDIRGDCFGERIEIISRNPAGYNVTGSGDAVGAACIF